MSSSYEFWLTDDAGKRITLLKNFQWVSYSRSSRGLGVIQLGLPLDEHLAFAPTVFQPDWRIDVWRSPEYGFPKRRESSYFLRKFRIYDREEDGLRQIEFFGRTPLDILRRWAVYSTTEANYKKTDYIDDMMKAIVTQEFVTGAHCVPTGELTVEGDLSLGPSITHSFLGKTVRDVLDELKAISFTKNADDPTNRRIFFDVVESGPTATNGFNYIFRTYADLRGVDRTQGVVFSMENGNLKDPEYYQDFLDQVTVAQVGATQVSSPDTTLSRWNSIMNYKSSSSSDATVDTSAANRMLFEQGKDISFGAYILNTPGSPTQPRSLYGVDWDFGDLLPIQYAGVNMEAEVEIVWVSVDENGAENIVGSNRVGV